LYVTSVQTQTIAAFSINASTGMLTEVDIGEIQTGLEPESILSVSSKYLYVGNLGVILFLAIPGLGLVDPPSHLGEPPGRTNHPLKHIWTSLYCK